MNKSKDKEKEAKEAKEAQMKKEKEDKERKEKEEKEKKAKDDKKVKDKELTGFFGKMGKGKSTATVDLSEVAFSQMPDEKTLNNMLENVMVSPPPFHLSSL